MTPLAAYLLLFLAVGVGFIFVHLVAGKLVRPSKTNPEKETIYECGEPTIGSAWVQFDLRFYVVALLFVIFDVEVAFFFPWAEVFGKSNAIRATADPKTLAEYNDFAAKVNDLASPRNSVSGTPLTPGVLNSTRERELWRKLETMTDKEYAAYAELKGDLTRVIRQLGEKRHEDVRSLTDKQLAVLKEQSAKLDGVINEVADRQKAEAKQTVAAINKLSDADRKALDKAVSTVPPARGGGMAAPPVAPVAADVDGLAGLIKGIEGGPGQVQARLRTRSLDDLQQVTRSDVELLSLSAAQGKAFQKLLPERSKALNELAALQAKQVTAAASDVRASLLAAGEGQAALWDILSVRLLAEFAKVTPAKLEALQALTPEGLVALETPMTVGVKRRAETLAWLALIEILVFFGVLLVGFAYLWRRGDLAWVRSTAAEEEPAKAA
jgi:NADH:ubiquinone oxidoreductase subunit 3 (subunit A)